MNNKILDSYFFILFSIIPVSIILGPAMSLIVILLIDFSFVFLLLYKKEYKFLSNRTVKLILFFSVYLIFNSIVSKDFSIGAWRNFGFIRFGILFCAFNYFFYYKAFFNKIFIVWSLTLFILVIDVYIENFTGKNILGYGELYLDGSKIIGQRIVSFFKDEAIAGGYVNAFYLIVVGYFFSLSSKFSGNYKYLILILSIIFVLSILFTGERSNSIKAIFGLAIFYFINDHFRFKEKIISTLLFFIIIGSLINSSDFLKMRYKGQFLEPIFHIYKSEVKKVENLRSTGFSIYYDLYQSGFYVFKKYPLFGVGNKNYRLETCANNKEPNYACSTHPHQTYFELLSEHGFVGTMILLFLIFTLVFSKLKIIIKSKNYIQIGCFIFLFTSLIPFLPSGAFFGDYSLTIFWLNLSLMYAINKKTNIFLEN